MIYKGSMDDTKTINVTKYESGTYFLKIDNANNTFVKKLIIE